MSEIKVVDPSVYGHRGRKFKAFSYHEAIYLVKAMCIFSPPFLSQLFAPQFFGEHAWHGHDMTSDSERVFGFEQRPHGHPPPVPLGTASVYAVLIYTQSPFFIIINSIMRVLLSFRPLPPLLDVTSFILMFICKLFIQLDISLCVPFMNNFHASAFASMTRTILTAIETYIRYMWP